jgi:hypothetical protein
MGIVCGNDDIITRAIALTFATGTDRFRVPNMRVRKGNLPYVFQTMIETGFPFCVLETVRPGFARMREPLPIFVALVARDISPRSSGYEPTEKADDILPTTMIGDVPEWALDWYTRPGRVAIRAFLKRDTPTTRWIEKHVAPRHRAEFLGGLVFRTQGGLLRRRLQWPTGQHLRQMMEIEANGFGVDDASEVLDLLRNDLPVLTEERRHVL